MAPRLECHVEKMSGVPGALDDDRRLPGAQGRGWRHLCQPSPPPAGPRDQDIGTEDNSVTAILQEGRPAEERWPQLSVMTPPPGPSDRPGSARRTGSCHWLGNRKHGKATEGPGRGPSPGPTGPLLGQLFREGEPGRAQQGLQPPRGRDRGRDAVRQKTERRKASAHRQRNPAPQDEKKKKIRPPLNVPLSGANEKVFTRC
ncbi:hypothetical protein HPG69_004312 [Diceros bicornis minor]|uniref:Uncharacterized protein n=1 Tax=Diceros bicornis minor TaxID=77932 RepID=A0A7J7EGH3_DICBM|nr:hypothetical protein HPG69_004312 [Diceros bicornis minor]